MVIKLGKCHPKQASLFQLIFFTKENVVKKMKNFLKKLEQTGTLKTNFGFSDLFLENYFY